MSIIKTYEEEKKYLEREFERYRRFANGSMMAYTIKEIRKVEKKIKDLKNV